MREVSLWTRKYKGIKEDCGALSAHYPFNDYSELEENEESLRRLQMKGLRMIWGTVWLIGKHEKIKWKLIVETERLLMDKGWIFVTFNWNFVGCFDCVRRDFQRIESFCFNEGALWGVSAISCFLRLNSFEKWVERSFWTKLKLFWVKLLTKLESIWKAFTVVTKLSCSYQSFWPLTELQKKQKKQ